MKVLISTSLSTEEARRIAMSVHMFFDGLVDGTSIDIFSHVDSINADRYEDAIDELGIIPSRLEFIQHLNEADVLVIIPNTQRTKCHEIVFGMGESVSWEYTLALCQNIPVLFWDKNIKMNEE